MREDAARLAMTTTTARGSGGERSSSAGGISNRAPDTIRAVLSFSLKRTACLYDYDHRTLTAISSATLVRSLSPLACARRSSITGSGPPPGGALRPVDVRYPPVDASLSHRASTRPRRESALPPPPPREPLALALALAAPVPLLPLALELPVALAVPLALALLRALLVLALLAALPPPAALLIGLVLVVSAPAVAPAPPSRPRDGSTQQAARQEAAAHHAARAPAPQEAARADRQAD